MQELKNALGGNGNNGGMSDRSVNYMFNQSMQMYDGEVGLNTEEDSVGSDEMDEEARTRAIANLWENANSLNMVSLQILRQVTQKMEKGDETDQAI